MGNRAMITDTNKQIGVYLHWNGGRDSIEAFLKYCELRQFRTDDYGWARLCQVIGNFFGGGMSLGVFPYPGDESAVCTADDNGVYIIDNWKIVDRVYPYDDFEEQYEYDLDDMVRDIDLSQPESEQLGSFLDAVEIPTSEVRIGDIVYMKHEHEHTYKAFEVVGFLDDADDLWGWKREFVGKPYVSRYMNNGSYANNCNNFITTETCHIVPRS